MESYHIEIESEDTRWGYFDALKKYKDGDLKTKVKELWIMADKNISYQKHNCRSEIWFIASGLGVLAHNGKLIDIKKGDSFHIAVGDWHGVKATEDLTVVEIQYGTAVVEDDIERMFYDWDEMIESFGVTNEE